ncbi:MAG TPA: bifunctional DNA-binding transcriptional regulator/O6-methylguanine-DNA methyltransferase Ada [Clostridia bacterium]|nr:bifunctional DNA-binding transcriptional regulator/O6-methylguanine-DNA methyltransferase Ada [Clostridia bacterium]
METSVNNEQRWQSVLARDRSADGSFYYAVRSTGVYCRPTCPSRRPKRENVTFFATTEAAERAGFRACGRCRPTETPRASEAVERACEYIRAHADESVSLDQISQFAGMTKFHLIRVFRAALGVTPREYLRSIRNARMKNGLVVQDKVIDAIFDAGFSSTSRAYEQAAVGLGMTPSAYKAGGKGMRISYAVFESKIGHVLIACTERGVCAVRLGDSSEKLVRELATEFHSAALKHDPEALSPLFRKIESYLAGQSTGIDLPLDIRATAFQARVWQALRQTRPGDTLTYSELAQRLGTPRAVRAVARACATNPVALTVPCHRVIRRNGDLAGYRWGLERKKALLKLERGS